ncbi:glycoside hydrolase family 76 protein [Moniliophthora roreri MCA 2997]|uniref:Glycoside hydrolase family 76 protein n=1 Tax=Moniliophthora roreri (strain MCA 2997) TaxID=1381753 RepID=V2X5S3_MONRO|nr:glycoside hydrolase family 76 protein [Moniliophthora roreri MCA 2997]
MYSLPLVCSLSLALLRWQLALAERLDVPSKWREPNVTLPFDRRAALASSALDVVIGMAESDLTYQHDVPLTLSVLPLLSKFDSATNQTKYRNQTEQFFSRYADAKQLERAVGDNTWVDENLVFGYTAFLAYTAYKDSQYLSTAKNAWDFARRYTLLEEDITTGTHILELNYDRIQLTCNGESMAGGTTEIGEGDVFLGWQTILFLRLSALLYEATLNNTYLNAAKQSADFIQIHLTQSPGFVQGGISLDNCRTPSDLQSNFSDTAGIFIHGLSILSSTTKNSSLMSLVEQSVATVTNQVGVLQKDNGIQANDRNVLENLWFIDGLGGAYTRFTSSDNLRNYTGSFLAVQYNALLELATEGQSNVYSGDWSGPPQSAADIPSQTSASGVLVAGIMLGPGSVGGLTSESTETSTTAGTSVSAEPSQPPNLTAESTRTPTGAIAGGVIGGVALITVIALTFWICRRRRRQNGQAPMPFNTVQNDEGEAVDNAAESQGRKYQEVTSSQQEQLEQANTQQYNTMPPIEDMVRVLYERYQSESEAPPSYRAGPT